MQLIDILPSIWEIWLYGNWDLGGWVGISLPSSLMSNFCQFYLSIL